MRIPVESNGVSREYVSPIPNVLIPADSDIPATLDRLFPSPFFDVLRAKYAGKFAVVESKV